MSSDVLLWFAAISIPVACLALALTKRHSKTQNRVAHRHDAIRLFCKLMPKVELHAHLSGCARLQTIAELAPSGIDTSKLENARGSGAGDRSLATCFAIFDVIHKTITTLSALRRITVEVLWDFAADNVKYLELRTTPRALADACIEDYIRTVLGEIARFDQHQKHTAWPMTVRLLLSVDRRSTLDRAVELVELAARMKDEPLGSRYIVGIDFSGNPTCGSFVDFAEAFTMARCLGLKTAVHVAEIQNASDTAAVLDFRPERLGHAVVLTSANTEHLQRRPIPIELCPTSNMKTLHLDNITEHPTLQMWHSQRYPISINTDDSSVFVRPHYRLG